MALPLLLCACVQRQEEPGKGAAWEYEKKFERGPAAVTLKVRRTNISIADRITLTIEAAAAEGYEVELPKFGEKLEQFGIVDYQTAPPKLTEGNRVVTARSYVLEPFLSGEYHIPPMTIRFREKDKPEAKAHELETEAVTVKVGSVLPAGKADLQIRDIAGPVALARSARGYLYAALAGLALLGAAGVAAFWLWRRRRRQEEAIRLAAHEIAYRELEALLGEKLLEKGEVKLFYYRVSDILRRYIEGRFGLRAPERTTEEFLGELRDSERFEPRMKQLLQGFLKHCDLVKFATLRPGVADIQKTFDACKEFIEATKATVVAGARAAAQGGGAA
jgi:hypothetical protein